MKGPVHYSPIVIPEGYLGKSKPNFVIMDVKDRVVMYASTKRFASKLVKLLNNRIEGKIEIP